MSTLIPRSTLLRIAKEVPIEVPKMSTTALLRKAITHYNKRNPGKRKASLESDQKFLARISVNYLRHRHSTYDADRNALHGVANPSDRAFVGAVIKGRVLREIARHYPMLHDEAQRQANAEDAIVNGADRRSSTPQRPAR